MEFLYNAAKVKSEHVRWDDGGEGSVFLDEATVVGESSTPMDESGAVADEVLEVSSTTSGTSRKKSKRQTANFEKKEPIARISFAEARKLLLKNKNCGLKLMKDKRHITIGWHQAGKVFEAIKNILERSVGQYRQPLKAVPLAIGKILLPENAEIIGSQSCMHLDVTACFIVFQPTVGRVYNCIVTSVEKDLFRVPNRRSFLLSSDKSRPYPGYIFERYLTAKIFNTITFVAPLKDVSKRPSVGDEVSIKFLRFAIKGNMCQMKGTLRIGSI